MTDDRYMSALRRPSDFAVGPGALLSGKIQPAAVLCWPGVIKPRLAKRKAQLDQPFVMLGAPFGKDSDLVFRRRRLIGRHQEFEHVLGRVVDLQLALQRRPAAEIE